MPRTPALWPRHIVSLTPHISNTFLKLACPGRGGKVALQQLAPFHCGRTVSGWWRCSRRRRSASGVCGSCRGEWVAPPFPPSAPQTSAPTPKPRGFPSWTAPQRIPARTAPWPRQARVPARQAVDSPKALGRYPLPRIGSSLIPPAFSTVVPPVRERFLNMRGGWVGATCCTGTGRAVV